MLVGKSPDTQGIAKGVFIALGFAALSDIKSDFIRKSRGGVGEDGERWQPLTREYLAYGRRFGRGEQAALKKAAGLGKGNRFAPGKNKGLLTADQLKQWNRIFAQSLSRFLLSMPSPEAAARAAAVAWIELKNQGAKTKLQVYGSRKVEILRDTGVLFNSLSPGKISTIGPNATYTKPSENQIFDTLKNGVIVGTNVPYAAVHNYGHASRPKMPKRQFIPEEVPEIWWQRWLDLANKALFVGARMMYENH